MYVSSCKTTNYDKKTVTAKTQKALLQKFNELKFRYAGANLVKNAK